MSGELESLVGRLRAPDVRRHADEDSHIFDLTVLRLESADAIDGLRAELAAERGLREKAEREVARIQAIVVDSENHRVRATTELMARAEKAERAATEARAAALEEAAKVAEARFTQESVVKNGNGEPYLTGKAAIYAGTKIAAAIRTLSPAPQEEAAKKLTAQVSQKFGGEVSDYKVGEAVEVIRIYGDECTVQDERGYRCIVGVPLRYLDFADLARAALRAEEAP